jgi:predicted AlkP superfamily pyrophosphatase or phosphodiesterase
MRYLRISVVIALILATTTFGQTTGPAAQTTRAATQPTRPVRDIARVVIIGIDGLRPDLALRADTPTLHALMAGGSFTLWARTTAESVTLPSHTSMVTGVVPIKHGIQWNADLPLEHPVYPAYPTLFELAKRAGYTTALAAGKSKFIALTKPGTLDWQFVPASTKIGDMEVAVQAVGMILNHQPDVLFVHFPGVDNAGHEYGWASREQFAAIHLADECVGLVLWALEKEDLRGSTFVLVTADHGGAGLSHGPDDPRSRNIPWIASGPHIRRNLDLTVYPDLTINTEDTFSTSAYFLGIPIIRKVDGKVVLEIVDRSNEELMHGK